MRKTAYLGLFSAAAILFGYVESLFPVFLGIPGIKLGLANLVTVFLLYQFSWKEAALVSLVRIFVTGFLFGNLFSILFSLAGAALSLAIMVLLKKKGGFSPGGVSVAGGVAHNVGQILVAAFVVENVNLFYYLPVLLIAGVVAGFLMGILAGELLKRVRRKDFS
ncbi:MAG: Gx transporter family protein [Blautia sp.]